jgi:hypothetical protein
MRNGNIISDRHTAITRYHAIVLDGHPIPDSKILGVEYVYPGLDPNIHSPVCYHGCIINISCQERKTTIRESKMLHQSPKNPTGKATEHPPNQSPLPGESGVLNHFPPKALLKVNPKPS